MSQHATNEVWLPIPGYEGYYEASSLGEIRGVDRLVIDRRNRRIFKGKKIKGTIAGNSGYLLVPLSKHGVVKRLSVHRLVALTFHGEPEEWQVCCHNNGVKTDNRAVNLRWDSRSANEFDKLAHGTHGNGSKTHCKRGHSFDAKNTRIRNDGYRTCRECDRMMKRAWYHRNKAQAC